MGDLHQYSDGELMQELRAGNMVAFDFLYKKYSKRLYKFGYTILKSQEDAENLLQDVFLCLWENRFKVEKDSSVKYYLFTVTYNSAISLLRKKAKESQFIEYLQTLQDNTVTSVDVELEYGPYDYKGSVIDASSFAPGYEKPTWPMGFLQGRHGNFFEWNNQWYFTYCDISQTGNRYFRDSFISYVHYKDNGEMAIIRVDGTGVGEYDANKSVIEAEDFFNSSGIKKSEKKEGGFVIGSIENNDFLVFPNIKGLNNKTTIEFRVLKSMNATIEICKNSPDGALLAICKIPGEKPGGMRKLVEIYRISEKHKVSVSFLREKERNSFSSIHFQLSNQLK